MKSRKGTAKKYRVTFEIKGSMIDQDTPLSEQSLTDFVELEFADRQDCKITKIEVVEVKEE